MPEVYLSQPRWPVEPRLSQVVLTAVRESGLALRCASAALRGEPEIVLAAVEENGQALEFAVESLRDDRHWADLGLVFGSKFGRGWKRLEDLERFFFPSEHMKGLTFGNQPRCATGLRLGECRSRNLG